MALIELTAEQRETLNKHAEEYRGWLKKPDGQREFKEHRDHEKYFKQMLAPNRIDKLSESEFREVYKTLWASRIWTNKDWYIDNKLIEPNGLNKIKLELKKLLYGHDEINVRYDEFHKNVKGFGPSSISEILHFVFPDRYCLWNEKPKTVLPFLGLHNLLPEGFFKYQITSGDDYLKCVKALGAIKDELKEYGITDFIDLDTFVWHIFRYIMPTAPVVTPKPPRPAPLVAPTPKIKILSHEGGEFYLLELGKMLGFLTYVTSRDRSSVFNNKKLGDVTLLAEIPSFAGERDLSSAREIDVIWFGEDENPKYCIEVEHTTDIRIGLNRLAQLQHLYAKFLIVGPEERRPGFEANMKKYPYRGMRERYKFISYDELASLFEAAAPFHQLKTKLLGEE